MIAPDRGRLIATSQAVSGLHSDCLRAEPSRLLRDHSHFGHFLVWAGCNMSSPSLQLYAERKDRHAAPASAAADSISCPSLSHAGSAEASPAAARPKSAESSPAASRPKQCGCCGSVMNKAGACHRCWFEKWNSVVHLKDLEDKAACRLTSMRLAIDPTTINTSRTNNEYNPTVAFAGRPTCALGSFTRIRSCADALVGANSPKRQRRGAK